MRESLGTILNRPHNAIINGGMDFHQRFDSTIAAIADAAYSFDRFQNSHVGPNVIEASRVTASPVIPETSISNFLEYTVTTSEAVLAAGSQRSIRYHVEGFDLTPLLNRDLALAFWVRSNKIGQYACSFHNAAEDQQFIKSFTIDQPNTWERKKIIIPKLPTAVGGWDFVNGKGLTIYWTLASGTDFEQAADSEIWGNGAFKLTSAGQVNFVDTNANTFDITGIMLSPGKGLAQFVRTADSISGELIRVGRYYEKTYNIAVSPGTVTTDGQHLWRGVIADMFWVIRLPQRKRASPVITLFNPVTGTSGQGNDGVATSRPMTSSAIGEAAFTAQMAAAAGPQQNFHWTADAEL